MITAAPHMVHRFKRVRFLLLMAVTLVGLFYYSFLNEEHELNHQLADEEMPRVTKEKALATEVLPTWEQVVEKNKYFPMLEDETPDAKRDNYLVPDEYFLHQKATKLRKHRKKEHYPVGRENFNKLHTSRKHEEQHPEVQSSYFTDGGRKEPLRLARVKKAFMQSWKVYKDYGYGHDEVKPLSHRAADPFNGWSATLVDALDTLVLMGEEEELRQGVDFLKTVNFKQSHRDTIPIFENVIRIMGGLLSAYEMTDEKTLLQSAEDLAHLVMEAFDTPNRMPLLYYKWTAELQNRFASKKAALAEVGTLSLEFTKLTQLTGDNRYFDAATRITNLFQSSQKNFLLPGLYSNHLDISGCHILDKPELESGHHSKKSVVRTILGNEIVHCLITQEIRAATSPQEYSMGGLGDSFYEYMPKMFHLLRGDKHSKSYKQMYLDAVRQVREFMLFRPKIPGSPDVLFVSSLTVTQHNKMIKVAPKNEMQHLSCFAGGMLALGSRLFDIAGDLDLAEKITMGCVEMYKELGMMPEMMMVDRMDNDTDVYSEEQRIAWIKKITEIPKSADLINLPSMTAEERQKLEEMLDLQLHEATALDGKTPTKGTGFEKAIPTGSSTKHDPEKNADAKNTKADISPEASEWLIGHANEQQQQQQQQHVKRQEFSIPQSIQLVTEKYRNFAPLIEADDGTYTWRSTTNPNQPIWINEVEPKYILRPEAIESVFYMYRITGDSKWRDYGWMMWENIEKMCQRDGEYAEIDDIFSKSKSKFRDSMESFWFSETLKYFYLLFEDISVWSLDDYVYNTEAHPFMI